MADADVSSESQVRASSREHQLRRQLGVRDLVLAQILCVVGSSWVGVAAGLGRGQTVMWCAAMALFYLPMAAVVIELNRALPLEGGLYVWAHQAFGDLGGFLTACRKGCSTPEWSRSVRYSNGFGESSAT